MGKRIIILTGSELRHTFFRKFLALELGIEVLNSYCEGLEKSMVTIVEKEPESELRKAHLAARAQSEKDFFGLFVEHSPDNSRPIFIPKGEINSPECAEKIISVKPDLLVAYGCSIIKEPLLSAFPGRFLNVHLGLSPYYRGCGTNYWPLVNGEPEYVGATFMYIDAGIDTGEIIHQIRAEAYLGDGPAQIGNRLISAAAKVYSKIITNFDRLQKMSQPPKPAEEKYCKRKDFSEESVERLYQNFRGGMIEKYLSEKIERTGRAPIVENPEI